MDEFMKDRYGVDQLTTALGGAGVVLAIIGLLAKAGFLQWIGLALLVVALLRALSKDKEARSRENARFREAVAKLPLPTHGSEGGVKVPSGAGALDQLKRQARMATKMWKGRKEKAYLKCPTCNTVLAVPRGKGKIIVTCPKCHARMETRS